MGGLRDDKNPLLKLISESRIDLITVLEEATRQITLVVFCNLLVSLISKHVNFVHIPREGVRFHMTKDAELVSVFTGFKNIWVGMDRVQGYVRLGTQEL